MTVEEGLDFFKAIPSISKKLETLKKVGLEYIKIVPTNMTPVKHYGYSAQWFLMFSVLCFMYVFYGFRRNAK